MIPSLKYPMYLQITDTEQKLLQRIGQLADILGVESYAVGGFVRDKLLSRHTTDIDIVCIGDSALLAQEYKNCFAPQARIITFKNFGVSRIEEEGLVLEITSARKESYERNSRKPIVHTGTFMDDQKRRDFTINTLAVALHKHGVGEIIDTFRGIHDLQNKMIRTPLDAVQTFSDDPLRILRAARFASQLNFHIEPDTQAGMRESIDRLAIVSRERIADELHKIMRSEKPSIGLLALDDAEVLAVLLPELTELKGVHYIDNKGHKDNFFHSLAVLDNICEHTDKLWLRWASLLHDMGKARTKKFTPEGGWNFHMHEYIGSEMVYPLFKRLKFPTREAAAYVKKIILLHHRPISLTGEGITDTAIRRLLVDAGDEFEDLMTLCRADITSKNEMKVKRYRANFNAVEKRAREIEEEDKLRNWQPPITGEFIMQTFSLPPCKQVGLIKDSIREAILSGEVANTHEAAVTYMHEVAKRILA